MNKTSTFAIKNNEGSMDSIDAIKINFSQDNLLILNICLAFIMFAIALDMKKEDFSL